MEWLVRRVKRKQEKKEVVAADREVSGSCEGPKKGVAEFEAKLMREMGELEGKLVHLMKLVAARTAAELTGKFEGAMAQASLTPSLMSQLQGLIGVAGARGLGQEDVRRVILAELGMMRVTAVLHGKGEVPSLAVPPPRPRVGSRGKRSAPLPKAGSKGKGSSLLEAAAVPPVPAEGAPPPAASTAPSGNDAEGVPLFLLAP